MEDPDAYWERIGREWTDQVEKFLGDGRELGIEVQYSYDGPARLGTAGALKKALPLLGDSFFVLYGDSYLDVDYQAVARAFAAAPASLLHRCEHGYTPQIRPRAARTSLKGGMRMANCITKNGGSPCRKE